MKVQAQHQQSVLDLLLQHSGSIAGLIRFAQANARSATEDLVAGAYYELPDEVIKDVDILDYYRRNGIVPATANIEANQQLDNGIGSMAVGVSFEVF